MEIHDQCFASTKKGQPRKYIRKAYETSKQLAQRSKLSERKLKNIEAQADMTLQLTDKLISATHQDTVSYGDLQQMIVLLGRGVDMMMKELTGKSIKIAL